MEALLTEAFEDLRDVVAEGETAGSLECIACDPRPRLQPLFGTWTAVATLLLEDKQFDEFGVDRQRMLQEIGLWSAYRCCGTPEEKARPSRNREMDARAVLIEKCGTNFERNRQKLRQVVRMPGDRTGCFQSRACRSATEHNGAFIEAGFWTYDGEYYYIWGERRTPRGDWVTCDP